MIATPVSDTTTPSIRNTSNTNTIIEVGKFHEGVGEELGEISSLSDIDFSVVPPPTDPLNVPEISWGLLSVSTPVSNEGLNLKNELTAPTQLGRTQSKGWDPYYRPSSPGLLYRKSTATATTASPTTFSECGKRPIKIVDCDVCVPPDSPSHTPSWGMLSFSSGTESKMPKLNNAGEKQNEKYVQKVENDPSFITKGNFHPFHSWTYGKSKLLSDDDEDSDEDSIDDCPRSQSFNAFTFDQPPNKPCRKVSCEASPFRRIGRNNNNILSIGGSKDPTFNLGGNKKTLLQRAEGGIANEETSFGHNQHSDVAKQVRQRESLKELHVDQVHDNPKQNASLPLDGSKRNGSLPNTNLTGKITESKRFSRSVSLCSSKKNGENLSEGISLCSNTSQRGMPCNNVKKSNVSDHASNSSNTGKSDSSVGGNSKPKTSRSGRHFSLNRTNSISRLRAQAKSHFSRNKQLSSHDDDANTRSEPLQRTNSLKRMFERRPSELLRSLSRLRNSFRSLPKPELDDCKSGGEVEV